MADLIGWIHRLEGLELYDLSLSQPIESLKDLLASVAHPAEVRHLSLARLGVVVTRDRLLHFEDVSTTLAAFIGLSSLDFRPSAFHRDCLPGFRALPLLNTLTFYPLTGGSVSVDDVKALISGLEKLPSLRKIELQQVVNASTHLLWKEWQQRGGERYVAWSEDFTLSGVADLLEFADKEGVGLEGLAVDLARAELARRRKAAEASKASIQGCA